MNVTLHQRIERFERRIVTKAFLRSNYNIAVTARTLGISRPTMYERLRKHRLIPKAKVRS